MTVNDKYTLLMVDRVVADRFLRAVNRLNALDKDTGHSVLKPADALTEILRGACEAMEDEASGIAQ